MDTFAEGGDIENQMFDDELMFQHVDIKSCRFYGSDWKGPLGTLLLIMLPSAVYLEYYDDQSNC